jgi:hypothetical protein
MQPTVPVTSRQRHELIQLYRKDPEPEVRFRTHILLLLADGHPWTTIEAMLFCRGGAAAPFASGRGGSPSSSPG